MSGVRHETACLLTFDAHTGGQHLDGMGAYTSAGVACNGGVDCVVVDNYV